MLTVDHHTAEILGIVAVKALLDTRLQ
jgi:hypothetical protein